VKRTSKTKIPLVVVVLPDRWKQSNLTERPSKRAKSQDQYQRSKILW